MTVCDINLINSCKCTADCCNILRITDHPYSVTNAIWRNKIVFCILLFDFIYGSCDSCIVTVRQEDWSCLCITDIYVADTILFLFRTCIFMLFDHIILIVIDRRACGDTGLCPSIHGQLINIITSLFVPDKIPLCHHIPQGIMRFLINLRCISIYGIIKLCFGTVDFQKRFRFPQYFLFCFFSIVYIIW